VSQVLFIFAWGCFSSRDARGKKSGGDAFGRAAHGYGEDIFFRSSKQKDGLFVQKRAHKAKYLLFYSLRIFRI